MLGKLAFCNCSFGDLGEQLDSYLGPICTRDFDHVTNSNKKESWCKRNPKTIKTVTKRNPKSFMKVLVTFYGVKQS